MEGLFSAKGRNNTRAIAILVGDYEDLSSVVEIWARLLHGLRTIFGLDL